MTNIKINPSKDTVWHFKFPDAIYAALGMFGILYFCAILGYKTLNPIEIIQRFYSFYGLFVTVYMWLLMPLAAAYWIPEKDN